MDKDLEARSEALFRRKDKIQHFRQKFGVSPYKEAVTLAREMGELANSIPSIDSPATWDELLTSELKRKLIGEAFWIERRHSTTALEFHTATKLLGIPDEDLNSLRNWLLERKEIALATIDRIYNSQETVAFERGLRGDIPRIGRQATEFASTHIQNYHRRIGSLLEHLTQVGSFLHEINAEPTTDLRSYFDVITKTLALSVPSVCYSREDGSLQIRHAELIRHYGHEGMGHAMQHILTNSSSLPFFLTRHSELNGASAESVAQYYQFWIFEDLKKSPECQKDLGIDQIFDELYQLHLDTYRLDDYKTKIFQYAITVLGDKTMGDPSAPRTMENKVNLLMEVALDPSSALPFIESHRHSFDSQGNLDFELIKELKYAARPVDRANEIFKSQGISYEGEGRSLIDRTFLTGHWTPVGFVDNARLKAEEYVRKQMVKDYE